MTVMTCHCSLPRLLVLPLGFGTLLLRCGMTTYEPLKAVHKRMMFMHFCNLFFFVLFRTRAVAKLCRFASPVPGCFFLWRCSPSSRFGPWCLYLHCCGFAIGHVWTCISSCLSCFGLAAVARQAHRTKHWHSKSLQASFQLKFRAGLVQNHRCATTLVRKEHTFSQTPCLWTLTSHIREMPAQIIMDFWNHGLCGCLQAEPGSQALRVMWSPGR